MPAPEVNEIFQKKFPPVKGCFILLLHRLTFIFCGQRPSLGKCICLFNADSRDGTICMNKLCWACTCGGWHFMWNGVKPPWEEVLRRTGTNPFPSDCLNYFGTPNFLVWMSFKQISLGFFCYCAVRMIIRKEFISLFNSFVCFVIRMFLPIIALLLWDLEACRMLPFLPFWCTAFPS